MAGYRKVASTIPQRAPEMLVRDRLDDRHSPWNEVAPGLYPDETVVKLSTGELVAVSVEPEILPNNAGVALTSFARWIEEDGSTKIGPGASPVETSHSASFDHGWIDLHTPEQLRDEVVKLVLGEKPAMTDIHVDPEVVSGQKPQFADGQDTHSLETADPAKTKRPIIDVPEQSAKSSSIVVAIANVRRLEKLGSAL